MSFARYLSKLAALINSSGQVPPAALSTGGPSWDASGLLGLNKTSPSFSLDILNSSGNLLVRQTRSIVIDTERNLGGIRGGGYSTGTTIVDAAEIGFASSGAWSSTSTPSYISFATTASGSTTLTERMRIDPSGNVGIGVAPNAWGTNWSGRGILQLGDSGSYFHGGGTGWSGSSYVYIGNNGYYDGSAWKYTRNAATAQYTQEGSAHVFSNAAGGTAGSTISLVERARIDSNGNLLVGTTSKIDGRVSILSNSGDSACIGTSNNGLTQYYPAIFYHNGGLKGYILTSSTSTTYATSSDYRLKENVQPMTGALSVVQALKPCTYTWKADGSDGQGFIAHELQAVVPDCVTGEKDAVDADGNPVYQGIDTSFLVATLTAAIQEQQAIIEQLRADVDALKAA